MADVNFFDRISVTAPPRGRDGACTTNNASLLKMIKTVEVYPLP